VTLLRSDHRISDFIEAVKGVLLPGAHTLVCKLCLHVACHVIAVTAELQTNVALGFVKQALLWPIAFAPLCDCDHMHCQVRKAYKYGIKQTLSLAGKKLKQCL